MNLLTTIDSIMYNAARCKLKVEGANMKVRTVAIIEIILGALMIGASYLCPSPYSGLTLGAVVLIFGIVLLAKPK
jgi:hypothetical protein